MSNLPLEGIRVVELTTGAAGPTVGRVLCEFGAEVIRCETRLRGDGHRGEDPKLWNQKPDFVKLQRGKKSFTVNMQTAKGRDLVKRLVQKSDVLIENFGLGILEKWGLDFPQLQELNPACILIRVKGMGCTGPHATDLTYGPNVINNMGATYLWNYPDATTATAEPRTQHPDFMGGVAGAFGVVAALLQRTVTGRGDMIDNAQLEIGASLLGPKYMEYSVNQRDPKPQGNRSLMAAPYGTYPCQGEDRWCVVSIYTQAEWESFTGCSAETIWSQARRQVCHSPRAGAPSGRIGPVGQSMDRATGCLRDHGKFTKRRCVRRRSSRSGRSIQTRPAICRDRIPGRNDRTRSRQYHHRECSRTSFRDAR